MKNHITTINEMLDNNDGIITSREITNAGIPRLYLPKMLKSGSLIKFERGIYAKNETIADDIYYLQHRYNRGVYSYETALYLHGLIDVEPEKSFLTFPRGYNAGSLKYESNIIVKHVSLNIHEIGLSEIKTPLGNVVKVYDIPRALCDMLKRNTNLKETNRIMREYLHSDQFDLVSMILYSADLKVDKKMAIYLDTLV